VVVGQILAATVKSLQAIRWWVSFFASAVKSLQVIRKSIIVVVCGGGSAFPSAVKSLQAIRKSIIVVVCGGGSAVFHPR
jgi:TPP-dependent trihydroxycyclohexane-1,2-dione (THcHDO) dehydratase